MKNTIEIDFQLVDAIIGIFDDSVQTSFNRKTVNLIALQLIQKKQSVLNENALEGTKESSSETAEKKRKK